MRERVEEREERGGERREGERSKSSRRNTKSKQEEKE